MLFNLCANWNETRGTVFNKKNTNLLQYAIQLVCLLKWNKRGSFQKNPIDDNMLLNSWAKRNKKGSFQKTTIYYSMLFNLCAYWNETRGVVFKKIQMMTICCWTCERKETRGAVFKKQQFITVCYSTCVRIEMKEEGQFSKKSDWWQYAAELVSEKCAYWNETRGAVFKKKKHKFITVCYSTCVRIEMKQDG